MLGRPPRLNLNEPLFHEPPRFLSDPVVVAASGKDWRLTQEDVLNFLEGRSQPLAAPAAAVKAPAAAPVPAAAPAAGKREERVRLTKMRQTIARRLKEAKNTAADRKRFVQGMSVSVRVDLGGRSSIQNKTNTHHYHIDH